jgi:hypothetical protein
VAKMEDAPQNQGHGDSSEGKETFGLCTLCYDLAACDCQQIFFGKCSIQVSTL